MRFGPVPVADAVGLIAAHGLRVEGAVLKKGTVVTPALAADLGAAGIAEIVAVALEPGDVGEDEAAFRLAGAVAGDGIRVERPFTGRANLFAEGGGLLRVEADAIDAANAVDEAVTVATLPAWKPVVAGEMVATVKIIPYAVAGAVLSRAIAALAAPAVSVLPWRLSRVGAISTLAPGLKPRTVAKTVEVLASRLAPAGARVVAEATVPHEAAALEAELRRMVPEVELIVVFGASAIADRRDVIPAALQAAGGTVGHFGMPVDPGNLLLVGRIGTVPVLGAPGCARSPKENGFDWILLRLLAGVPVSGQDIARMGVGGLLMEIVSRPQPRAGGDPEDEEA